LRAAYALDEVRAFIDGLSAEEIQLEEEEAMTFTLHITKGE
jgi:hypothetical protein